MITDRDFLRAERDYLTPPDTLRDDHAQCRKCRCMSSDLDDDGACPGCALDDDAVYAAAMIELAAMRVRWGRGPSRAHHNAVETARAEAATGVATRAQGWVAL